MKKHLDRNLGLYPWFTGAFDAYCWLPVFFLFFLDRLAIQEVLYLEAIYFLAVVVLEVPSGYFSDRVGRRKTLLVSALGVVLAHVLFFFGADANLGQGQLFGIFAIAQIFLAVGMSFRSGTDTVLHFETLQALNRTDEYAGREAAAARIGFRASAAAALIGGLVASIELRYAYGLSLLIGILALILVWFFTEPGRVKQQQKFVTQISDCLALLRKPGLAWLFMFSVFMTVLNHIPYEFFQPYLGLLEWGGGSSFPEGATPLVAGIHTAITMYAASVMAGYSVVLRDKFGLGFTLLLAAVLQCLLIFLMALILHPVIAALLLMRSLPRALMAAPMNAAIVPEVPTPLRATYLSMQSLIGRLSFSLVLAGLPLVAEIFGSPLNDEWRIMSLMLMAASALGLIGLLLLISQKTRLRGLS